MLVFAKALEQVVHRVQRRRAGGVLLGVDLRVDVVGGFFGIGAGGEVGQGELIRSFLYRA